MNDTLRTFCDPQLIFRQWGCSLRCQRLMRVKSQRCFSPQTTLFSSNLRFILIIKKKKKNNLNFYSDPYCRRTSWRSAFGGTLRFTRRSDHLLKLNVVYIRELTDFRIKVEINVVEYIFLARISVKTQKNLKFPWNLMRKICKAFLLGKTGIGQQLPWVLFSWMQDRPQSLFLICSSFHQKYSKSFFLSTTTSKNRIENLVAVVDGSFDLLNY